MSFDPWISEWGNPPWMLGNLAPLARTIGIGQSAVGFENPIGECRLAIGCVSEAARGSKHRNKVSNLRIHRG